MPQYQLWILDDSYNKQALLTTFRRFKYRQVVNGQGWAEVELDAADPKIDEMLLMRRLVIVREGEIVFGGLLLREHWKVPETAPEGETWTAHFVDHAVYAAWRVTEPPAGSAYDSRSGPADDVAKAYVTAHAGSGAATARQFPDLSVAADLSQADSVSEAARYKNLLKLLQELADKGGFDWRFVPTWSGATFTTAYPYWGVDRRKGNGVNDEAVFAFDRHNFRSMDYTQDLIAHRNHVYVGGQGEGADRTIVEVENASWVSAYLRRETFADARHLSNTDSLNQYGTGVLQQHRPSITMTAKPLEGTWKASSGTTWDLGDLVTVYARLHGREMQMDGQVKAVTIEVSPDGLETATPELEAV